MIIMITYLIMVPYELYRVLIAVSESKNFRDAALKLGISQPAVSAKIKELEGQHPLPLFFLEGKKKVLTHYGRALYENAKAELLRFDQSLEKLKVLYGTAERMTIRIGGRLEVLSFVSNAVEFEGKIEWINLSTKAAVEKLQSHEIDIAISYMRPDSTELTAKKLFTSRAHFAIHKSLLRNQNLNLGLVKDSKFLMQTPSILYSRSGHLVKEWLKPLQISLSDINSKFFAEDWRMVQHLVESKKGYSIIPSYIQTHEDVARIDLPTSVLPELVLYAIYEKSVAKIPALKNFLQFKGINS